MYGGLRKLPAGTVDETVDTAVRGPDRVKQRVDRIRIPDVGGMGGCLQIAASQMRDEGVELALVATDDGDMGAEPCEQPGDRASDAAGAAGDHYDQTFKRIGCEHRRLDRKLVVGQAGFCRRWRCVMVNPFASAPCASSPPRS